MPNQPPLKDLNIAVLMGGLSGERDVSLRSGQRVLDSLLKQGYKAASYDLSDDLVARLKADKIGAVYIALHGKYGEDGVIQSVLELAKIPYTGSRVLASALAMNKVAAKKVWSYQGVPTPCFAPADQAFDLPLPLVVKPVSEGSSLGVSLVKGGQDLKAILEKTVQEYQDVFVEEYISGTEVTVGIIGTDKPEVLPILELVPKNEFYDFEAKYTEGLTEFILPARLSEKLYEKTQEMALRAHQALGCYGVSRVDLIISRDGTPYVTEINTIPGMTDRSDLPAQALHAGISFDDLVARILESAF